LHTYNNGKLIYHHVFMQSNVSRRKTIRSCIRYRRPATDPHGSRTGSQLSI